MSCGVFALQPCHAACVLQPCRAVCVCVCVCYSHVVRCVLQPCRAFICHVLNAACACYSYVVRCTCLCVCVAVVSCSIPNNHVLRPVCITAVSCGMPAGMTRPFHYTTPYDAIVQDEDGELSLLNTSAHCDVTPALPPELACEPAYKVPRAEAEVQTQGQGHSMYSSAPLKSSSLELE